MSQTCNHCSAEVHGGVYLCSRCTKTLRVSATKVGEHYADIATLRTRSRAVRYDRGGGKGGRKEQPIGMSLRFARPAVDEDGKLIEGRGTQVEQRARNTVVTWARVVLEEWPSVQVPADNVPAVCAFLAGIATAVASQRWAAEMLKDLLNVESQLSDLVDIAPTRWYAGRCGAADEHGECTAELYAIEENPTIKCPACKTEHDVAARREVLLREASSYSVTASEAAGALVTWTDLAENETKLADRIRKWADRGRLEVLGHAHVSGKDRRLYRLGDVQELLIETVQREQETRLKKRGA